VKPTLISFPFAQMAFLLALFLALPAFAADAQFVGQSAPVNPLGLGAAPAENGAPAGYTVEVSTGSGESLVTQKPNIASVKAALEATLPDLAGYFGQRPAIGSAYQNAKDTSSGGATFSSTLHGHAVRGIISVKLQDGGAKIAIVFGRADAPKGEWEKLMTAPVQQASTTAPAKAGQGGGTPAANVALTEYDYPDGTGSIGLPEGWTTQAQSAAGGVAIKGPANQVIFVHNAVTVQTPDSPMVLGQQRADAQLAEMNRRLAQRNQPPFTPKPVPPMLVAPPADPIDAIQVLMPQFSKRSAFLNGPTTTFGKFISTKEVPSNLPNAKSAIADYTISQTLNGQSASLRVQAELSTCPLGKTAWMSLAHYSIQAPEATFKHDQPIMMAIVKSEKVDVAKVGQVSLQRNQQLYQAGQQMLGAQQKQAQAINDMYKQNAATQQRIHDAQQQQTQAGYDAHNAQFRNDQLQRSRRAADFNESIIGTRTIYDTVTGESGYANLTDVNGVVDSLNKAALDPNRFVQIPLRDQLYPLPPGK
jgi:hypothetical protein